MSLLKMNQDTKRTGSVSKSASLSGTKRPFVPHRRPSFPMFRARLTASRRRERRGAPEAKKVKPEKAVLDLGKTGPWQIRPVRPHPVLLQDGLALGRGALPKM